MKRTRRTGLSFIMRRAPILGSGARLCLIAGALASLVLYSAPAASAEGLPELPKLGPTGATGPTGPAGANGTNGERGPTGPAGSGGGGGNGEATSFGTYTGVGSTGGLASGRQESGGWSATIQAPAGSQQTQTQGVAQFSIPLKHGEEVVLNYRNEEQAKTATAPCVGSVEEPVVEPGTKGNFCAYRGGLSAGIKEKGELAGNIDRNVQGLTGCGSAAAPSTCTGTETAPFFMSFSGEHITTTTLKQGQTGVLITFRTTEFSAEAPVAIAEEANLNAVGSWGLTAK